MASDRSDTKIARYVCVLKKEKGEGQSIIIKYTTSKLGHPSYNALFINLIRQPIRPSYHQLIDDFILFQTAENGSTIASRHNGY